jgi:hypothetical protein
MPPLVCWGSMGIHVIACIFEAAKVR